MEQTDKILITGAAGFIGSYLAEKLLKEQQHQLMIGKLVLLLRKNKKILKNILTIEHMFNYNIDNK